MNCRPAGACPRRLRKRMPRLLAALLVPALALALVTCSDTSSLQDGPGLARMAVQATLPPRFSMFASQLSLATVQALLIRLGTADTLARRTVNFDPDASTLRMDLSVVLAAQAESLEVVLEYRSSDGGLLFEGRDTLQVQVGPAAGPIPAIPVAYVGPGNNTASLVLTPMDTTVATGDSVLYSVAAFDAQQGAINEVYVSWSTSDPNVTINANGLLRATRSSGSITVKATVPNGVSASTQLFFGGATGVSVTPDSVEKLPGGNQQFTVSGPSGTYIWSVHGTDGGNATFGTIDTTGFYTAPAQVPTPSAFSVCARLSSNVEMAGCATVVINPVPTAGTDVIVVNDENLFQSIYMVQDSNNLRFAANLVNYTTTGTRANGTVVMYDRGRDAACFADAECDDTGNATIDSVIQAQGYSIQKVDTVASWATIPSNVKVIFLWMPRVAYDTASINGFKQFAAEGGRIVFLGEHINFYLQAGLDVENRFLSEMGAQFTNVGAVLACPEFIPSSRIAQHQTTTGLSDIYILCASQAIPGPNDFPLFTDAQGNVVGGVAKISTVPLAPPAHAPARPRPVPTAVQRPATVDGLNRPVGHR